MNLQEYRKAEQDDSNLFWRLQSGETLNLLDEAIEEIEQLEAENKKLKHIKNRLKKKLRKINKKARRDD